jgi:hypothetical protein
VGDGQTQDTVFRAYVPEEKEREQGQGGRGEQWSQDLNMPVDTQREPRREIIGQTDAGNLCLTTGFSVSLDVGGGPLPQAGDWDILVASFTSAGARRWSRAWGGTGSDSGNGIAVDSAGSVYVAGYFQDTVVFGSSPVSSAGRNDIFLLKLIP